MKKRILNNTVNRNPQWKKIKLSGNLLSDDGGASLEGLLGLEVLENYDGVISVTKEKRIKTKKENILVKENSDDSESDNSKRSKNERKKKKRKLKNVGHKKEKSNEPGSFVRPLPIPVDEHFTSLNGNENKSTCLTSQMENDGENGSIKLTAWTRFGIAEPILKVLAEKGFKEPTEIQALTFPAAIMGRRDILGAAETGSGKTLAFGIPIINGILQMKKNPEKINFRKVSKNGSEQVEVPEVVKLQKNRLRHKTSRRQERENLTPPPEEINNFPGLNGDIDTVNKKNECETKNACNTQSLYALILTPTRELAVQVKDHLVAATKYTDIRVAAIFGGLATVKQERVLSKCPEIVVATPGRLWELLNEGNAHLSKLQNINFLVVDETDRMIEKGHFEELKFILDRVNADPLKKIQRQNFIFSATLTLIHDLPQYLKLKNMNRKRKLQPETIQQKLAALIQYFGISQPKVIDITQSASGGTGIARKLTECRISCSHEQKDLYLYYFLHKHPGRTIVFCNSIDCVRRLAKLFSILKCGPVALHAKMAQKARLKNLEKFTKNPTGLLVATDVAARGLDIPNVEHVIHYQVPRTSENYIHRSGRTARGNKEGIAILLMEPKEVTEYVRLCRTLKRSEDLPIFPVRDTYLAAVRERVILARKIDVEELQMRRRNADIGWLKKSAKEMDILMDDGSDFSDADFGEKEVGDAQEIKARRELKHLKDALKHLLSKPIFPNRYTSSIDSDRQFNNQSSESQIQNAVNVMKNAIQDKKKINKKQK
ncbi:ATP-dependent RNA helicase DDX24 isoform X2 [Contarinia nasturtii]|uniref:ATP-dependent RNA helicase DDX24 isoform X2 n=1 Tax=Contarinia nasturtii TaxID=265458 RepID=UPI0012D3B294|nr:ATP-dependent RNA helicase DDX24 isoform X2 [Contarinia nasturtii]